MAKKGGNCQHVVVFEECAVLPTVGSSACAAVGVVTELVDVHGSLGGCIMAFDVVGDRSGRGLRGLLESDSAGNGGVTA